MWKSEVQRDGKVGEAVQCMLQVQNRRVLLGGVSESSLEGDAQNDLQKILSENQCSLLSLPLIRINQKFRESSSIYKTRPPVLPRLVSFGRVPGTSEDRENAANL